MATVLDLPDWRRPMPGFSGKWWNVGDSECETLREALLDLTTDEPQTWADLAAGVRQHWGEASPVQITVQLRELVRDGRVRRVEGGYVRAELADESDGDA